MAKGYRNEYDFIYVFNDKFLYQLDRKYVKFLEDIYERKLEEKSYIICWKPVANNKTDIIIRVGNEKRYLSIKSGKNNSVHLETLNCFILFLESIGCSKETIDIFNDYQFASDSNGNKISSKEYQERYPEKLEILNKDFNRGENIKKSIDRFLFDGIDNYNNSVDVIIYGTPSNFKYATRKQITNYLLKQKDNFLAPHFSSLVLQPWARNLNNNPKHEYRRNYVQVKWYRLDEVFEKICLY